MSRCLVFIMVLQSNVTMSFNYNSMFQLLVHVIWSIAMSCKQPFTKTEHIKKKCSPYMMFLHLLLRSHTPKSEKKKKPKH